MVVTRCISKRSRWRSAGAAQQSTSSVDQVLDQLPAQRASVRQHLDRLRQAGPSVIPSLLMCDFTSLGSEIQRLESAGAPALHLDVMDGHFVPNLSYGFPLVEAIRRTTDLPLDTHLMISNPDRYLQRFYEAGADIITVHAEAVDDPTRTLAAIRDLGAVAGIAVSPPTPLAKIERCLPYCDLVLVMSVMPGFGGQSFDPAALEKLRQLNSDPARDFVLEIDGGVNDETIGDCTRAGADLLVVGSAIFDHDDYRSRFDRLSQLARDNPAVRGPR